MAESFVSVSVTACASLADAVSLTPLPGNEPQNLHRDGGNIDHIIAYGHLIPHSAYFSRELVGCASSGSFQVGRLLLVLRSLLTPMTNCVIALVDFNAQNGPTRFVRGSHLRSHTGRGQSKGPSKPGSTQHIQDGESGSMLPCNHMVGSIAVIEIVLDRRE